MRIPRNKLIWVFITIILGAIGSGVWSYVLHPLAKGFSEFALTIITFGYRGLEDEIYMQVAKGHHESASLQVLGAVIGFTIGLTLCLVTIIVTKIKFPKNKKIGFLSELFNKTFIVVLILVFFIIFSMFISFRTAYTNDQITYFNQMYDIAAPFIDEQERLALKSRFAQIENKSDYDSIIESLKSIVITNNQSYRNYDLFY